MLIWPVFLLFLIKAKYISPDIAKAYPDFSAHTLWVNFVRIWVSNSKEELWSLFALHGKMTKKVKSWWNTSPLRWLHVGAGCLRGQQGKSYSQNGPAYCFCDPERTFQARSAPRNSLEKAVFLFLVLFVQLLGITLSIWVHFYIQISKDIKIKSCKLWSIYNCIVI